MDARQLCSLLRACLNSKSPRQGKLIHQKIVSLGLQSNNAICKNLINYYLSFHLYDSAHLVFRTTEKPFDISLWNALMAGYTKNFMCTEALELFERLLRSPHLKPDCYTYPNVLKACGALGRVGCGMMIHAHLIKTGSLFDVVVVSALVSMYAKCNSFEYAVRLFDEIPDRDVACWNTVISCYYQDGQPEKALELSERMRDSGFEPNSVTLTTVISCCARLLDLERGKKIHMELVRKGFVLDGFITSALVDMYGRCGCLDLALDAFDHIPRKTEVAWNSMIGGYSLKGDSKSCIELFGRMNEDKVKPTFTTLTSMLMACSRSAHLHHGKFIHSYIIRNKIEADIITQSSLIDLYFKCGNVVSAENVFREMPKTSAVSWNVMISGYVAVGSYFNALGILSDMKEAGVNPDAITYTSVLPACSHLAALEEGKEIHKCVIESKLESNEVVMGALLDMYAKCGAVDEALNVFHQLPHRDAVSWTSMITAYGSHGQPFEALKLFDEMQQSNAKPDEVTFLAVLSACSHAGLVDEGRCYFNQMVNQYAIKPGIEHYSCLIDLLGRAGRLHEACEILQRNPEIMEDSGLLSTLFSACHLHKNLELGVEIAGLLIEKDPDDPSTYIILSNIYASAKRWDEVRKVRSKMKELGLKKNPGCSWIEINKKILTFFVDDKSHPQSEMVYDCLSNLSSHMENDELLPCQLSAGERIQWGFKIFWRE